MSAIEERILVLAPQSYIFDVSQRTEIRDQWDPFTKTITYAQGYSGPAKGAEAYVEARNGFSMQVKYISFIPPVRAAIVMPQGPAMFRSFAGTWIFERIDEGRTLVRFCYQIKSVWGLEQFLMWLFRRNLKARLRGLKAYCELHCS